MTKAGAVLLDASRTVLSLVDHEVHRTRQSRAWAGPACGWWYRPADPAWAPGSDAGVK